MSVFAEFGDGGLRYELLKTALSAAVPLHILSLKEKGGPDSGDFAECGRISDEIGACGDSVLFKTKGKSANVFNRLAYGMAIMSFCPGGVKAFGLHFQAETSNGMVSGNESDRQPE